MEGRRTMTGKNIFVCGGDTRSIYMADYLKQKGCNVRMCMTDSERAKKHGVTVVNPEYAAEADAVVLGLPAVRADMTINSPLVQDTLYFENLLDTMNESAVLLGGRFGASAANAAKKRGIRIADYSENELFQTENAFYTAEGTIEAIIKSTSRSICSLSVFVVGYGRIGRAFTSQLLAFTPDVTVYARRSEVRSLARLCGAAVTDSVDDLSRFDVVVNTVPSPLLTGDAISTLGQNGVIIDLSARPGYVDRELCSTHQKRLIYLPGLPSVCAPISAGETAARAVLEIYAKLSEGVTYDGA